MLADGRFYLGHLGKTPVYVAPEAALNLLLIWMWSDKTLSGYLVLLMAFITVILIHEAGHAAVARMLGMQGISITLSAFGGFCAYGGLRQPRTELPIALAGPLANLLTAGGLWLLAWQVPQVGRLDPLIGQYGLWVFLWSLVLGIFNLLPIYPLDGGQATLATARMLSRSDANARRFTLSVTVAAVPAALIAMYALHLGVGLWTFFILAMLLLSAFRDLR